MAAAEPTGGGKGLEEIRQGGGDGDGDGDAHNGERPTDDHHAPGPSTSSASDNGNLHRSSTMPGVIKDTEITTETTGPSNLERSKTERRKQNNPADDPVKQLLDDKISIRKRLKMLNRIVTVKDDGTVVVNVPSTLEATPIDVGAVDGYEDVVVEESLDGSDIPYKPPIQIVILIVGTRGDVQQFVAIGKCLQDYGHRVRLATHANYKEFILTAGLEFFPLGGDPKFLAEYMVKNKGFLPSGPSEIPIQRKQMKEIIFSLYSACQDPDPVSGIPFKVDAIIANPPAYGHKHVAEALKVPIHTFFTMPCTPTSEFPHPLSRVKTSAGYREKLQSDVLVSKSALRFQFGNTWLHYFIPEEVKATWFQICTDELGSLFERRTGPNPHRILLQHLKDITDNFNEDLILGSGGFGMVYKGVVQEGRVVAVKKLVVSTPKSHDQFKNEVDLLMKLDHPNIVRLVGYCYDTQFLDMHFEGKMVVAESTARFLCLECMSNGSLDKYISDASSGLDWRERCKIIEGISYGLHYLHYEANDPIIHLDLKPANILLGENLVPKITDFGLLRIFGELSIHTRTPFGTRGYMAVEYQQRGIITPMADIFSLGVIILEVITGHRDYPYDIRKGSEEFIKQEL